jgi:predicted aminopeptidase
MSAKWRTFCCLRWLLPLLLLGGCADAGYYRQSVAGHLRLMAAARPMDDWLADAQTPEPLRQRLRLAQDIRRFAVSQLHLPDNPSYRSYADLRRRFVVWNVVAAPEFSLELKTWCFPVAGCVGYRGYFDEHDAQALATELRDQGLEATVYGVPAYSTLGWMNWLGGDPVLNTFVNASDVELARLMFHELAHQLLYVSNDTAFNESFATAVERLGGARWLATQATPQARLLDAGFEQRRQQFRALTRRTRERLDKIYAENPSPDVVDPRLASMKDQAMQDFRQAYAALKDNWGGDSAHDAWVARANNATFGAQAAYDDLVPAFEALFERTGADWPRFFAAARQLAKLPLEQRMQQLQTGSATAGHPDYLTEQKTGPHG